MSQAFLALWNDYPDALAEEYEAWHTFEHVPERLTAPGMLSARRYVSRNHSESYFTLYELQDLSVIEHPAYLDLVRNPTPWSQKMRRHFSNVLRIPGETAAVAGHGIGGAAIVQAYAVDRNRAESVVADLDVDLRQLIDEARILGFRVAIAEPNQAYEVFRQQQVTDPGTVNVVIVIEGGPGHALAAIEDEVSRRIEALLQPQTCLRKDVFNLLMSYRGEEFPGDRSQIAAGKAIKIPTR